MPVFRIHRPNNTLFRQLKKDQLWKIVKKCRERLQKIELLEMDKAGIAVAEYWTHLPPKDEFESKIKAILIEAKERLSRRKSLSGSEIQKQIEYFYEPKDDENIEWQE